jgi:uncharacterized protein (DUF2141 family)
MKIGNVSLGLACCVGILFAPSARSSESDELNNTVHIAVTGFRNDIGILVVSICDDGEGFPGNKEHIVKTVKVHIDKKSAHCEIAGLQPGTYAIIVHHDEDEDGKIKSNIIKIPKEGLGASNNAKMKFGPPKWKDAKFEVGTAPTVQKIVLKYF